MNPAHPTRPARNGSGTSSWEDLVRTGRVKIGGEDEETMRLSEKEGIARRLRTRFQAQRIVETGWGSDPRDQLRSAVAQAVETRARISSPSNVIQLRNAALIAVSPNSPLRSVCRGRSRLLAWMPGERSRCDRSLVCRPRRPAFRVKNPGIWKNAPRTGQLAS